MLKDVLLCQSLILVTIFIVSAGHLLLMLTINHVYFPWVEVTLCESLLILVTISIVLQNFFCWNLLVTTRIVAWGHNRPVLIEISLPFLFFLQGIFCRYPEVPPRENWQLRIEKSVIQTQRMFTGIITFSSNQGVVSDTSHILESIARNTQDGGRLICIEMTGQQQQQNMGMAMHGISPSEFIVQDILRSARGWRQRVVTSIRVAGVCFAFPL